MSRTRGTGPARQAASSLWLVETLATVLVGLFLLAGIVQLAATRAADQHHESALMRRQAEGRTALEAVARELRMAGYAGCARLADRFPAGSAERAEFQRLLDRNGEAIKALKAQFAD